MKTRERCFNLFNDGAAARGRRRGRRFDHRTKDNLFLIRIPRISSGGEPKDFDFDCLKGRLKFCRE